MKVLVAILIFLSFIQVSILPINFVLLVLLSRAFLRVDKANLYLGFAFGLLLSYLNGMSMGIYSIAFLNLIALTHALSKAPISKNVLTLIPLTLFSILLLESLSFLFGTTPDYSLSILWPLIFIIPVFILIKWLDERFVVEEQFRLKL